MSYYLINIILIGIVVVAGAIIAILYNKSGSKKDDIKVEFIKILSQGVIIGLLGLIIKYAVDDTIKIRDAERAKNELSIEAQKNVAKILLSTFSGLRTCWGIEKG